MKTTQLVAALSFFALIACTEVKAQNEEEKVQESSQPQEINIPESYNQTQNQLETEAPAGTSTYNLAENETPAEPGAAPWRAEGEVEVLRIYSGSHDGNNVVKTIEVRVPDRDQGSYYSRSEYVPK